LFSPAFSDYAYAAMPIFAADYHAYAFLRPFCAFTIFMPPQKYAGSATQAHA